ncbi:MAG: hypothetical protein KatS3mg121_1227 [Gammaproteobacteria bacterium]|nr:MAG: hypothetical protein KatS3mg121_1227 [Gammaproteobacteria bacterium]
MAFVAHSRRPVRLGPAPAAAYHGRPEPTRRTIALRRLLLVALSLAAPLAAAEGKSAAEVYQLILRHCGACHGAPAPELLPRKDWPYVVDRMVELAAEGGPATAIPELDAKYIKAYYLTVAPETLPKLPYFEPAERPRFAARPVGGRSRLPLIGCLRAFPGAAGRTLLACDDAQGALVQIAIEGGRWQETVLARLPWPIAVDGGDVDGDGDLDLVVAALGEFFPTLAAGVGKLFLLRRDGDAYRSETLLDRIGRVADARLGDFDGDSDLDIAVAVFGHDAPGRVTWLENRDHGKRFVAHPLLELEGAINVSPVDLDDDGRLDIVTMLTQNHERMVLLRNRGGGRFEPVTLFQASHPLVGATRVELADLDRDGDPDIVFATGDANDLQHDPKPYHGLQWLENRGGLRFELREIGRFYGAAALRVADLDGDGDLDVVAGSWNNFWNDPRRQALVWFENDGRQNFSGHALATRPAGVVALDVLDLDGDGRRDILAGAFAVGPLEDYVDRLLKDRAAAKRFLAGRPEQPRFVVLSPSPPETD